MSSHLRIVKGLLAVAAFAFCLPWAVVSVLSLVFRLWKKGDMPTSMALEIGLFLAGGAVALLAIGYKVVRRPVAEGIRTLMKSAKEEPNQPPEPTRPFGPSGSS